MPGSLTSNLLQAVFEWMELVFWERNGLTWKDPKGRMEPWESGCLLAARKFTVSWSHWEGVAGDGELTTRACCARAHTAGVGGTRGSLAPLQLCPPCSSEPP